MRFGYLDPPYLGMCGRMYDHHHPDGDRPFDARCWDEIDTHRALVEWAVDRFDGWALSLSSSHLHAVLPLCPDDVRVMAWVKPWAAFRPNVNPAYAWEPVIVRGGRPYTRDDATVRDWVSANATMMTGQPGAKPVDFSTWIFRVLNVTADDEFDDVFVGSGMVSTALAGYLQRPISIADSLFQ